MLSKLQIISMGKYEKYELNNGKIYYRFRVLYIKLWNIWFPALVSEDRSVFRKLCKKKITYFVDLKG